MEDHCGSPYDTYGNPQWVFYTGYGLSPTAPVESDAESIERLARTSHTELPARAAVPCLHCSAQSGRLGSPTSFLSPTKQCACFCSTIGGTRRDVNQSIIAGHEAAEKGDYAQVRSRCATVAIPGPYLDPTWTPLYMGRPVYIMRSSALYRCTAVYHCLQLRRPALCSGL